MPIIGYVQSASNAQSTGIPRGSSTNITTSVTLNGLVPGNWVVCIVGGLADGGGSLIAPQVTDDGGNVYSLVQWVNAGTQLPAIGIIICTNIVTGGTRIITFQTTASAPIGLLTAFPIAALAAAEVSGVTVIQGSGIDQHGVTAGPISFSIVDSNSITQTVAFSTMSGNNQVAATTVDVAFPGVDVWFFGASSNVSSTTGTVSITPLGGTFTVRENPSVGSYNMSMLTVGGGSFPCPKSQRDNIDYDQIGMDARHGNGNQIQMFTGSSVSGNVPVFDPCGNIKDSGAAPGTGTVTHTSGNLTLDLPVFGNGGADIKVGTKSGNTDEVLSATGTFTSGNLLSTDANHNAVDAGFGTPIPIVDGGTGTTTPSLVAGTNITITGSWPNQTINASGGSSPLTTKGDIWGYDTGNNRIPVGSNGQVLTADSTQTLGVKWAAASVTINFSDGEVPSGTINGSNVTFTLANTPNPALSLVLFRNGVLQYPAGIDFTLSSSTITFVTAPLTGDNLITWYRY